MKKSVRYVRKRSFKNFSETEFCRAVKQLSWWDVMQCENPDQAEQLFTTKLTTILGRMAPLKTFQVHTKYAAWLSEETKQLKNERDAAQAVAAQSRDLDDWRLYKNLRNTVTARNKAEKKAWEQNKLDSSEHNPSIIWKNVKGWLNWGNSGPPTQLFHNGNLVNSP